LAGKVNFFFTSTRGFHWLKLTSIKVARQIKIKRILFILYFFIKRYLIINAFLKKSKIGLLSL